VDRMIQGLKYRREMYYGRILGQLLSRHLAHRETRPALVIPVPLACVYAAIWSNVDGIRASKRGWIARSGSRTHATRLL
jgi:hypothetical protein